MSPSVLPDGEAAPEDGALPASAAAELHRRALGAYVHVPFCATRCGYCDFNTYTPAELGDLSPDGFTASKGVTVNAIAPSLIMFNEGDDEAYRQQALDKSLMKIAPGEKEISDLIDYLFTSRYVTGRSFAVDGGRPLR